MPWYGRRLLTLLCRYRSAQLESGVLGALEQLFESLRGVGRLMARCLKVTDSCRCFEKKVSTVRWESLWYWYLSQKLNLEAWSKAIFKYNCRYFWFVEKRCPRFRWLTFLNFLPVVNFLAGCYFQVSLPSIIFYHYCSHCDLTCGCRAHQLYFFSFLFLSTYCKKKWEEILSRINA